MQTIVPVILAGGSGTRLWPLSRGDYPKQLLRLSGQQSLLQITALRADGLERGEELAVERPLVVCNEELRFLVTEQLDAVGRAPQAVLLEPVGRNTAPALGVAAHWLTRAGKDPLMLVMPADHVVRHADAFVRMVRTAVPTAADGAMVTFGIVPTSPETGYGYIQTESRTSAVEGDLAQAVQRFVEKPDRATAERYLADGRYLWNSGIFMMRASIWLSALRDLNPEMLHATASAIERASDDLQFTRLDRASFARCPADSIDYAVMEPMSQRDGELFVVPADIGWSDLGSWSSLYDLGEHDGAGNVCQGDVHGIDSENCLLISDDRFLATVGVRNLVVVSTPDALLVADRSRTQDVREVVEYLSASNREEARSHRRVYRPWGSYEPLDAGDRYQVKRLTVKPGARLSLQMHHHRAEHWTVVRGTARVTRGEEEFLLSENESTFIPLGTVHRLENPGQLELEVIEVQSGSYLGEDDIVRFEDQYNRVEAKATI